MSDHPDRKPDFHEALTSEQATRAILDWLIKTGRLPAGTYEGAGLVVDVPAQIFHLKAWK